MSHKIAFMLLKSLPRLALHQVRRLRAPWLLLLILLVGAPPLYRLLGPRGVPVVIEGKTWRFEIDVEHRLLETDSDRCDALPPDAVDIKRTTGSERCRYSLPAWRRLYRAQATGAASQPPVWPVPDLQQMAGIAPDALRLGPRHAFFELQLRADNGQLWTCALPRPQWQQWAAGFRLRLAVDRFGTADCGRLPAP